MKEIQRRGMFAYTEKAIINIISPAPFSIYITDSKTEEGITVIEP